MKATTKPKVYIPIYRKGSASIKKGRKINFNSFSFLSLLLKVNQKKIICFLKTLTLLFNDNDNLWFIEKSVH